MDSIHDNGLYPAFKSYDAGHIDVGDGHTLYFEVAGNPDGLPVVYLHGGPGAGCSPQQRRYFNPDIYRVIQFDQRGAGRSTPPASTHANTTDHLIKDIETVRTHLHIDQWLVAGGSWGVTLALAYGERHAKSCLGFLLRGVFLGTQGEVDWFLKGMGKVFPEAYQTFSDHVGGLTGDALFAAYYERLTGTDDSAAVLAARVWAHYEIECSTLFPPSLPAGGPAFDAYAVSIARLEAHYFKHKLFLEPDELVQNLDSIKALPAIIVQGRYDMVCPIETAYRLHLAWPGSKLNIVTDAGHSGFEPHIAQAMVQGADDLAKTLIENH